ncbi:hypothetical protein FJ938_14470 [Mesorhizobium sp. B2-4-14]|uniref:hypothetical protein n=1 Tax=Mesorhizobium sp. B2-4-14 TaxID=2589935 RepID=UPI00112DB7AF|nr:hypothetical protein [Mesorhizobium sp. B2-4-14]TPL05816.1 hypothetical protein FJ938_14470 [Mesorhizobium sp. B2-4-14]
MPFLVIDSSMLQSQELRSYLQGSPHNFAVLADYAWIEIYKQQTVEAIKHGLSVVGDFPDQLVLLRANGEIIQLDPIEPDLRDRMQFKGTADSIREMAAIFRSATVDDAAVLKQVHGHWSFANGLLPELIEGAVEIAASLPEMEEQMFTKAEIRIIRTSRQYPAAMMETIYGAAMQIWETLAHTYGLPWQDLGDNRIARTYLFRYALGLVIHLLWWISSGSQPVRRMDRMSNDMIDLSFCVYASYFDGFMTADEKARWIHANLVAALEAIAHG